MSKAKIVLTALLTERLTVAEIAARYGVHRSWVYRLKARYEAEGDAALEPRSRRPHHVPSTTPTATIDLILALRADLTGRGLDAGADTIGWHLAHHHATAVSRATINRVLARHDARTPDPSKRPRSSWVRFAADLPNETWQSDFTHYRLTSPAGTPGADVEIITWLDDHSRMALHISAHRRITAAIVHSTFTKAAGQYGFPASTLTDNGMVYTVRLASRPGGRTRLETELRARGIKQKNSRPNHPTTCGKVERFQQTMKKWLRAQDPQPASIAELQQFIDRFAQEYNENRPHRSLEHRATPAAAYSARPKARPSRDRSRDTHDRVRTDRIDKSGVVTLRHNNKLHHIGIGRTHAGTYVRMLVQDLDIIVIDATTGEILRELVLDPTKNYQPTGRPRGPAPGHDNGGPTIS
ncbi:IS481 family transposase [Sanguibacter massiliensis]|uniref:IS481 family transposase n=1 Tax=Sanguibacter massiliensis TaxID=1973217 RepID=UPI000C84F03E|nr:IS481 family transposase [Sanguibacter massiliensis]